MNYNKELPTKNIATDPPYIYFRWFGYYVLIFIQFRFNKMELLLYIRNIPPVPYNTVIKFKKQT